MRSRFAYNYSMASQLILLRKPVTPETLALARKYVRSEALANFADHLETARALWRDCPSLVKSRRFPEPYRSAYIEQHGYAPQPSIKFYLSENPLSQDFESELEKRAVEVAEIWTNRIRPR